MVTIAAQQSFYEAAAQVIPILLLVLAFEIVRYRVQEEILGVAYSFLVLVLGMIFGEVAALAVLASGHGGIVAATITSFGLGAGIGAVFFRGGLLARDGLRSTTHPKKVVKQFENVVKLLTVALVLGTTMTLVVAGY